jgi:GAF domain-containing protein
MNRARSFPLGLKLALAFVIAIVVPGVILLVIAIDSSNRLNRQNLEAFVEEFGQNQRRSIEDSLATSLRLIDTVVTNLVYLNDVTLALRLVDTPGVTAERSAEIAANAATSLRQALFNINQPYIESAWLLNLDGTVMAPVASGNNTLPFNLSQPREQNSDSYRRAQTMLQTGEEVSFVVANRNNLPSFEIVRVIRDRSDTVLGFLVADLDLDEVVFRNLVNDNPAYDLYSFVTMPDGISTLQLLDVRRRRLVDPNSLGVERALTGQPEGVTTYAVDRGQRVVIGYYTPINILDNRLALVTEIDEGVVVTQRLSYFSQVAFPVVISLVGLLVVLSVLMTQIVVPPLNQLRDGLRAMTAGNFDVPITFNRRNDELGEVGTVFIDMRNQVQRLIEDMRMRLQERARDVRLTQDISRAALAERDVQTLLNRVINLIVDNFQNIYHAQVFLVDDSREYAVLRASTGRPGQELLQRGHRLAVGSVSVIGQVAEQGQLIIARDISASNVHRQNEFLRETQAELAIPLRLGTRVIGVLDVQSKQRDSFTDDQIAALQTLADQLTIAIENARLYEESQRLLQTLDIETRARTRRAWQETLNALRLPELNARAGNQTGYDATHIRQAVMREGRTVVAEKTARGTIPFAVPVVVRGQTLGVVDCEVREVDFNLGKVLLAEELVSRLALALDNARLFQDSMRTADRERLVNEISARLTSQTDIESIIETAIQEVSSALGTPQVALRFHSADMRISVETQAAVAETRASGSNGHALKAAPQSSPSPETQENAG